MEYCIHRLKVLNEEKGELIAEAVISNSSDMSFNNASLKLVEGTLNKYKEKRPRPERANRPMAMAKQNDGLSMMDKDELGDYHIYSLNENMILEQKENITR